MEQRFIQEVCNGAPVRRLECNGDKVAVHAIAARVGLITRFLKGSFPIVVVFDRERRAETSEQLRDALFVELERIGLDRQQFVVGVPDRTIENWVLADKHMLEESYQKRVPIHLTDGCFGKNELKQFFDRQNPYSETTDGPKMLKKVKCSRAVAGSKSFSDFCQSLSKAGISCWWLDA